MLFVRASCGMDRIYGIAALENGLGFITVHFVNCNLSIS